MMDADRCTKGRSNVKVHKLTRRLQALQSAVPGLSNSYFWLDATIRELDRIERVLAYAASHPKVKGNIDNYPIMIDAQPRENTDAGEKLPPSFSTALAFHCIGGKVSRQFFDSHGIL
jgi:hypothetical protein